MSAMTFKFILFKRGLIFWYRTNATT